MQNPAFKNQAKLAAMVAPGVLGMIFLSKSFYTVKSGQMAIKFNAITGLQRRVYTEGLKIAIPFIERPIIFYTRNQTHSYSTSTPNKDLQIVKIKATLTYKPNPEKLPEIYTELGLDYDKKVLNNIISEVLRGVIAHYSSQELNNQRDQISREIREGLSQRAAKFNILVDEFALSSINFSDRFKRVIEEKQMAQQNARKASFEVISAREEQKSAIINGESDAKSIELIGERVKDNPAYLQIQKLKYSKDISEVMKVSRNRVLLNSDNLILNSIGESFVSK